jgi:thiol-disulfide isomerase/thioredoxin
MQRGRRALLGHGLGLMALQFVVGLLSACHAAPAALPFASAPPDWNAREVVWAEYGPGLAAGKSEGKPILLVLYTDWCPHCHNYSRLFHDPELVLLSRRFVMIRVERDANRDISEVYDIDGEYIPRTFFLTPTGLVLTDLVSDNDEFRYFLDEHDPTELKALMLRALDRLGKSGP